MEQQQELLLGREWGRSPARRGQVGNPLFWENVHSWWQADRVNPSSCFSDKTGHSLSLPCPEAVPRITLTLLFVCHYAAHFPFPSRRLPRAWEGANIIRNNHTKCKFLLALLQNNQAGPYMNYIWEAEPFPQVCLFHLMSVSNNVIPLQKTRVRSPFVYCVIQIQFVTELGV